MDVNAETLKNCLTGIVVGDALGLPYENLSPARTQRLLGDPDQYRFLLGRGMVSDDTELSCIIAQCLIASAAPHLRRPIGLKNASLVSCLPAGIGRATVFAITRVGKRLSYLPADKSFKDIGETNMKNSNARLGVQLFVVYLLLYGGFVMINAFAPTMMEMTPVAGINLAILYGFGLIIAALVMALIYGALCSAEDADVATSAGKNDPSATEDSK